MTVRKFNDETEIIVISLYKSGGSLQQIADYFRCWKSAVQSVLTRNDISRRILSEACRKFNNETELQICQDYKNGLTERQLAEKYSCSSGTIHNILIHHDTKRRPKTNFGKKNGSWKGAITPENKRIRDSIEYKEWRKQVFERDYYTCQNGGKEHGNQLHAHHKKPFADYPELRFNVDNGLTLCIDCHIELRKKKQEK